MSTSHSSLESKIRTGTTVPSGAKAGDMYYDTGSNVLFRYNGAYWSGLAFPATTTSTSSSTSTTTSTSTSTSTTSTSSSTSTSTTTSTSTSTTTTL